MTLAKLLTSYILDISSTYGCMGLMWCLHELTYEDHLKECVSCSKCSINVSSLPFYQTSHIVMLGEAHCPPWPGTTVTICIIVLQQEVPVRNTELITLHQLEEFGKGQSETPYVRPPPRILFSGIHLGWIRRAPPGRTLELEWLAKDNPETNPITIKPQTASMWQSCSPGFLYPTALHPGALFPIKSLALSAHVSPQTIHFQVLDKSPVSGPGRGPPSCNSKI